MKSKKYYYLINGEWMNSYKTEYFYNDVKKEFENKSNKSLHDFINSEYDDKILLKKVVYRIIRDMSDWNKKFNSKNNFLGDRPSEPDYESLGNIKGYNFYVYRNFHILSEAIHNKIFNLNEQDSQIMRQRNNYCRCFILDKYIFVELNKFVTQLNKYVVEIGKFDDEKKFNLIYIIICDKEEDFYINMKILEDMNVKDFFNSIHFNENNLMGLEAPNSFIYRYTKDLNTNYNINEDDFNINNISVSTNPELNNNYSLKEIFQAPPSIGLQNVGATCYMNATIQCFGQLEQFVLYFKYDPLIPQIIKKNKNNDCLTTSFKDLIENLWPNNNKYLKEKYIGKNSNNTYFKPLEFKAKISKMNPLFAGVQANDSKDLVNFIIMTLHEELNIGTKLVNNEDPPQTNEMAIYNSFMQNYQSEYQSIISKLFYGINGTVYQCSKCQTKKYNFQVGFFYIFPLEEVRKFKISNLYEQYKQQLQIAAMNNYMIMCQIPVLLQARNIELQNMNSVNIFDCFDFNQKKEFMTGENSMYCNICNQSQDSMYYSYIVNGPEILIIILNRGQGIQFKVKLEFIEILDITNYVRFNNNSRCNYKLVGVVTHMGESGASGHFVAFCRSPINNQWYNYNDDLCFPINNFKEQVIDYAMPYILFYQKM